MIPIMTKFTPPSNYKLNTPRQHQNEEGSREHVIWWNGNGRHCSEERKLCEDCGEMKLTMELRATLREKCEECWEIYLDREYKEEVPDEQI